LTLRFSASATLGQFRANKWLDFAVQKAQHADKLIFITTGYFTRDAIREAKGEGAVAVELVDGDRLVKLFEEKRLGLRREEVFRVDHAFFNQFRQLTKDKSDTAI
jgi:restriction system protein